MFDIFMSCVVYRLFNFCIVKFICPAPLHSSAYMALYKCVYDMIYDMI